MTALALVFAAVAAGPPSILAELDRMDRDLAEAERALAELGEQAEELRKSGAALEAERAVTKVRYDAAAARYKQRLRALTRMPAGARLVVLGGSDSLADYLTANRLLRAVAHHDRRMQLEYAAQGAQLRRLEAELAAKGAELAALEASERERLDALAERRREKMALLEAVTAQRDVGLKAREELRRADAELALTLRRMQASGRGRERFSRSRGKLPWPAEGKIVTRFGAKVDSRLGTSTMHNGVDIDAPAGARVQAVAAGRVAYADWLAGYGRVVILDHGEDHHTVMAHLASIAVAPEAEVAAGTTIGTVGDTGSLRGTVLYFEVRQRGAALDPESWLRR